MIADGLLLLLLLLCLGQGHGRWLITILSRSIKLDLKSGRGESWKRPCHG